MKRIICILFAICLAASSAIAAFAFPAWSGDANGDGKINAFDVIMIMRRLAGEDISLAATADYDSDGAVNAKDVTLIMRYLTGHSVLTDSLLEAKYGVSEVSFEIPDPATDKEVFGAQFGFDPASADNSAAFNAAAAFLRDNPGTKLTLEKGVYNLGDAYVTFSGIKDCVIDGNGSVFMYDEANYFGISACEGLKFENLTIDWDWDAHYLASVVKVIGYEKLSGNGAKVTFKFLLEDDASYALTNNWDSMIHLDPETLVMSCVPKGDFFNVYNSSAERTLVAPDEIAVVFKYEPPKLGDTLLIRHYNYGPGAFNIGAGSNGIVFEDVNIYGLPGEGMIVNDGAHHIRFTRLTIGLNPKTADKHRVSTTADAMHIKETRGYYILEDCDIGYCGDDCLNIHDTVGAVIEFYENELTISASNGYPYHVGDTLSFRRESDFTKIDFTAVITSVSVSGSEWNVTLDRDCEDALAENMIVHDDTYDSGHYIIRNCFFHENRARGVLAGSSDCLIEGCRFYRNQSSAIQICIDIIPNLWTEGKGTSNMIIRNNEFDNCGRLRPDEAIRIFAGSGFSKSGSLIGDCFNDILISGNKFSDLPGYAIQAASVRNLTVYGNTFGFPTSEFDGFSPSKCAKIVITGTHYDDSHIFGNIWKTSALTPEDFENIRTTPSSISTITIENNTIEGWSK